VFPKWAIGVTVGVTVGFLLIVGGVIAAIILLKKAKNE